MINTLGCDDNGELGADAPTAMALFNSWNVVAAGLDWVDHATQERMLNAGSHRYANFPKG
jgi:hypothetical protein